MSELLRWARAVAVSCFLVLGSAGVTFANGAEMLPGGTRSVARGGAVAARPEDPMALVHNPAGLAFLSGNQFMLNVDTTFHDMCFDPYGYYGWGVYDDEISEFGDPLELDDEDNPTIGATYATEPLPEVCNSAPVFGLPQMAQSGQIGERLVIAGGFVAPTLLAGNRWGGSDGTIQVGDVARPTPTRYQLIEQEVLFGLNPAIGAGYKLLDELAVGLTAQIAMLRVKTTAVQNLQAGTQPGTESLAEVTAEDLFLPSVTASVHGKPLPNLDVVAAFRWADSFSGGGEARYETNTYNNGVQNGPVPALNDPFDLGTVTVGLPWALTLGARWSGLLSDEDEGNGYGDPLDRELWDIELDVAYTFNERAGQNDVEPEGDVTLVTREAIDGMVYPGESITVSAEDQEGLSVDRHLTNSIAIRLGGSYSVLPRTVAIHAGVFYETPGVEKEFAGIDSFAFERVGGGLGVMARFGSFDLFLAYAYVHSFELDLAPPEHENVEDAVEGDPTSGFDKRVGGTIDEGVRTGGVVLTDPDAPSPSAGGPVAKFQQTVAISPPNALPERVVNAGVYTAGFNILSLGAVYHF